MRRMAQAKSSLDCGIGAGLSCLASFGHDWVVSWKNSNNGECIDISPCNLGKNSNRNLQEYIEEQSFRGHFTKQITSS